MKELSVAGVRHRSGSRVTGGISLRLSSLPCAGVDGVVEDEIRETVRPTAELFVVGRAVKSDQSSAS